MLKIRRPLGRLIFNMGIAIPGKTVFLIETAPRAPFQYPTRRLMLRSRESRSREIGSLIYHMALKFDRHFGTTAAEMPVKFQSDYKSCNYKYKSCGFETYKWSYNKRSYQILKQGPVTLLPAVTLQPQTQDRVCGLTRYCGSFSITMIS